ncbi:hypothetical protein C8P66_110138 [Humitalea rosea]|uniref:Uncharacterized protein n=1 Tax=Humitalea rosea TaxID=990373 RepID=A0A2W7KE09_9PROT|nr:hypothetical protein [Humitalea rosea]PZW45940.1 hypothetical protein C8P66_110138 [Humitalea rosea]
MRRLVLLALLPLLLGGGVAQAQSNPLTGSGSGVMHGSSPMATGQDLNSATGAARAPTTRTQELRSRSRAEAARTRAQARPHHARTRAPRAPRTTPPALN